jgi:hypothetical protein
MKFKEFAEEVQRTCPDLDEAYLLTSIPEIQGGKSHTLPKNILNTIHMRLGMVSEMDELMTAIHNQDRVNIGEELGDLLWYVANDIRIKQRSSYILWSEMDKLFSYDFSLGMQVTNGGYLTTSEGVNSHFNAIVFNISKLSDPIKKYLAYTKPEPNSSEYIKTMEYMLGAINNLAYNLKINLDDYMEKVVLKLKKRYPDKFTVDAAINRDLDAERKVLETGAGDDYPVEGATAIENQLE